VKYLQNGRYAGAQVDAFENAKACGFTSSRHSNTLTSGFMQFSKHVANKETEQYVNALPRDRFPTDWGSVIRLSGVAP
jgi:hypothetical protein